MDLKTIRNLSLRSGGDKETIKKLPSYYKRKLKKEEKNGRRSNDSN